MNISLNVFDFNMFKKLDKIDKDGEKFYDFTKPVINDASKMVDTNNDVLVTKEFVARPDLISKIIYGSENYADTLMYYNGIGNFTFITEGMVLKVPSKESALNEIKSSNVKKENQSKIELNKKLQQRDKDRISKKTDTGEIKATNMVAEGSTASVAANGVIQLGTNVIPKKCKQDLSKSQLASEQIRKAIKLKLSGSSEIQATVGTISATAIKRDTLSQANPSLIKITK